MKPFYTKSILASLSEMSNLAKYIFEILSNKIKEEIKAYPEPRIQWGAIAVSLFENKYPTPSVNQFLQEKKLTVSLTRVSSDTRTRGFYDADKIQLNVTDTFISRLENLWDHYHGYIKVSPEQISKILNDTFSGILIHELTHAYDDWRSKGKALPKEGSSLVLKTKGEDAYLGLNSEVNARFNAAISHPDVVAQKLLPSDSPKGGFDAYISEFKGHFNELNILDKSLTPQQKKRIYSRLAKEYQTLSEKEKEQVISQVIVSSLWNIAYNKKPQWLSIADPRFKKLNIGMEFKKRFFSKQIAPKYKNDFENAISEIQKKDQTDLLNRYLDNFKTKLAAKYHILSSYDFPYYRVSDSKTFPIPPERKYDPYGMYLFIKGEYVDVDMWGDMKWRRDAKLKPHTNVLNLEKITIDTAKQLFKIAGFGTLSDVWNIGKQSGTLGYDNPDEEVELLFNNKYKLNKDNPSEKDLDIALKTRKGLGHSVYRVLRLTVSSGKQFSNIFKKAGFDGILDTVDAIYPMEPQCIIFNPDNIIWGDIEKNIPDSKIYCLASNLEKIPFSSDEDEIKLDFLKKPFTVYENSRNTYQPQQILYTPVSYYTLQQEDDEEYILKIYDKNDKEKDQFDIEKDELNDIENLIRDAEKLPVSEAQDLYETVYKQWQIDQIQDILSGFVDILKSKFPQDIKKLPYSDYKITESRVSESVYVHLIKTVEPDDEDQDWYDKQEWDLKVRISSHPIPSSSGRYGKTDINFHITEKTNPDLLYNKFLSQIENMKETPEYTEQINAGVPMRFLKLVTLAYTHKIDKHYKVCAATLKFPPKLKPYLKISGDLNNTERWEAKVWLENSGDANDTKIGYIWINPKTGMLVPVARGDEHHKGMELIEYFEEKGIIPKNQKWTPLWSNKQSSTYAYAEKEHREELLAAIKKWREIGGPDLTVRSMYGDNFHVTMDDFIQAKGYPKSDWKGKLAPIGQKVVNAFERLAKLYAEHHTKHTVDKKWIIQAGRWVLRVMEHFQHDWLKEREIADKALLKLETKGDFDTFENAIFGVKGLKNEIHNSLREAIKDPKNYLSEELAESFGDLDLAKAEFDRLGDI